MLPGVMLMLLLLCLAYWWLDNLRHEIFGASMFALLTWHLTLNRRWFANLLSMKYVRRHKLVVSLHLILLANVAILLATSVAISKSIFKNSPVPGTAYISEIHWFSAYWLMMSIGLHLGLHWSRLMSIVLSSIGIAPDAVPARPVLRSAAFGIACVGAWSFCVLDLWTKLTFRYSMNFWDVARSVAPFFGHWLSVIALPAIGAYCLDARARRRHNLMSPPTPARTDT